MRCRLGNESAPPEQGERYSEPEAVVDNWEHVPDYAYNNTASTSR